MPLLQFELDDLLTLKKKHPCGGFSWRVVRLGADIGLSCETCGRKILLSRSDLEKRVKKITHATKSTL